MHEWHEQRAWPRVKQGSYLHAMTDFPGAPTRERRPLASQTVTADASAGVIEELAWRLDDDGAFRERLLTSLHRARDRGRAGLRPALFDALAWPRDVASYLGYLRAFATLVPRQTPAPAWRDPSGDGDVYQELHDRMVHFYWLVDQGAEGPGTADVLQADAEFAAWLVRYAQAWGSFLDTPASLTPATLASFREHAPDYEVAAYELPGGRSPVTAGGWQTFNQFFARALPPGARPVTDPDDNRAVTFPADAALEASYPIDADGGFPAITVKHSHAYADVATLIGEDPDDETGFARAFRGGTYCHVHLKPYAYHRFHVPVGGRVACVRHLEGRAYLKTGIENGKLEGYNDATNGYEFAQQRGVLVLDTAGGPGGNIGLVAVVPVGMGHVSSVRVTARVGARMRKGEEFGQFLYGGSDVVLLFERRAGVELEVAPKEEGRVGEVLGRCGEC